MSEKIDYSSMLISLADQGVRTVKIEYDGSGDSGEITDICFEDFKGNDIDGKSLIEERKMIESLCENQLLDEVGDWYNNEGGFGSITIQIPSGEYSIDSHIRVTETIDESYSGNVSKHLEE